MQQMMMAAVLRGKEHVEIEQVPVPELFPGDLLVRVRAALTCGTDVKVFRRGYHAKMIVPPALFGHEFAGDVVAGTTMLGKRVVAANSAPCGKCPYCLKDKPNLCEDLLFNNGAYAEYIRVPARIAEKNTHEIPPGIEYRDAALTEPLACVLKGLEDTGAEAGDTVTVIGLGPIGMMFVILAKLRGARVIAVGRREEQVARARLLGAAGVLGDPVAGVLALTSGQGSDIVIEAVGKPETWEASVRMLRRGGTVNFFGGPPSGTTVALDTNLLHYSELTCKASFHHTPDHIRRAFEIICQGHINANQFVNQEATLCALPAVLAQLAAQNGALKTAILP